MAVLIGFSPRTAGATKASLFSIRQMIEKSVLDHGIDRRRVFITGLSAGGAMTSNMLACYPEIFAGGAIVAGLPYGAATDRASKLSEECIKVPPARHMNGAILYVKPRFTEGRGHVYRFGMEMPTRQ